MNQCDVPDTFLTPCFLLVVTSFFHSFPVFLNFSFPSRQYSQVTRAVLYSRECNFFDSQINCIKNCIKKRFSNIFFIFLNPWSPPQPHPPSPSSGLQLQYQTFFCPPATFYNSPPTWKISDSPAIHLAHQSKITNGWDWSNKSKFIHVLF